jgi:lipocalin
MARRRSKIYSDNDVTVMLKLSVELHEAITADAKAEYRSLPMHIISILNKRYNGAKEEHKDTLRGKNVLYTEQELKDMQRNYKGNE